MKVRELIEKLKKFPPEQTVFCGRTSTSEDDRDISDVEQEANKEVILLFEGKKEE